jgi:gamma-glutamyltranspeptidase/glutathione hydrolase
MITTFASLVARWRLVLLILILLVASPVLADRPQETPGVPLGTVLPETAQVHPEAGPPSWTGKAYRQGVVAVSHPLAAEAGAKALERGGNAIDAAAAIQFALNVVEPQFSGIGGGGFMMIHLAKTNQTFAIDCREKAPAAATPDMFLDLTKPGNPPFSFTDASTSGIAVGVPGTLMCLHTALKHWGTTSLADALRPAITLADEGFRINKFLAADTASSRTVLQPETKAIFRRADGSPLQEGDLLVQKDLAKTFRLIARHGPRVFYRGEIAPAIVEAQKRKGGAALSDAFIGRMALSDLAAYGVKIRKPTVGDYRGYTLKSMSPPSSGGLTVIQMLKMLERFPLEDASQGFGFGATKTLHVMIEAMRLAFADRAVWMGDEDFVHVPKVGLLNDIYVDSRADMISLTSRMATPTAGDPLPFDTAALRSRTMLAAAAQHDGGHTTHFSVVDKRGNIVSYTTTIEAGWGTGIMVPGYGFLLNNELTDFNFTPALNPATGNPGANDVAPFKRPRSSMTPTILFKGKTPIAAYGSPGGATIINSVFQITLNLIDHRMAIQDAINAPRISVTSAAGGVTCEGVQPFMTPAFPQAALDGLKALGHTMPLAGGVPTCTSTIGSVQSVVIDLQTGKQYGGADPRREGTVIGLPRPGHGH